MKSHIPSKRGKNIKYRQSVISFDIETTSYVEYKTVKHRDGTKTKEVDRKHAWMYLADFCNEGIHFTYRTWNGVKEYLDSLSRQLDKNERYIIWVHNLSFEFQFMKAFLKLTEVFCRKSHNVLRCVYKNIEFRDTLALSNCKLERLAINEKLPVQKLVGDLDYSLIRHQSTPISEKELAYQHNDTEIVYYYILKKVKEYGRVEAIPMTSTGEVRELFRRELGKEGLEKMHNLVVLYSAHSMELQNLLIQIYAGAYTHCNYQAIAQILYDLECDDIASSYPYQMVSKKYPTIWFKMKENTNLYNLFSKYSPLDYAVACEVEFYNFVSKHCHNIISHHKCMKISEDYIEDNGRIVSASYIKLAVNEIDLMNIVDFYNFDGCKISNVYLSKKEYLPKELVAIVLKLFKAKTELKGIEEEEENYMRSKQRINGVYGSAVFNILDSGTYFDEESNYKFLKDEKTFKDFKDYTNNPNQYLWYSIGVWVTSYARRQVLTPIKKMSENAIYCDTDSVKGKSAKRYRKLWKHLNAQVRQEFLDAMNFHKFSPVDYTFIDKHGVEHFMGVFEKEEPYKRFKSLGSKRYLVEYYDGRMSSTVAGAPKNLWKELGNTNDERFENFNNGFTMKNCKLTHTYVEEERELFVTDYLGNNEIVDTRSGVCLTPANFSMNMSEQFFEFLLGKVDLGDKDIYRYFGGQQKFTK